jgi:hypothetical protein
LGEQTTDGRVRSAKTANLNAQTLQDRQVNLFSWRSPQLESPEPCVAAAGADVLSRVQRTTSVPEEHDRNVLAAVRVTIAQLAKEHHDAPDKTRTRRLVDDACVRT